MRPQVTKANKRQCRKGAVKGLIHKRPKPTADPNKKHKVIIKKLIVGKAKSIDTKIITKSVPLKTDKLSPKGPAAKPPTAPKTSSSKQVSVENKNDTCNPKKRAKTLLPDKSKSVEKKPSSSPESSKSKPIFKTAKNSPPKNLSNTKNQKLGQDKLTNKLVRPPKKTFKTPIAKEKIDPNQPKNSLVSKNTNIRDSPAKIGVKKVGDSSPTVAQIKLEKDRSRSLEKKRLGVTRSSSAPLLPSKETVEGSAKESSKAAGCSRTSKASLENLAILNSVLNSAAKSSTSKRLAKTADSKEAIGPLSKAKEAGLKNSPKTSQERATSKTDSLDFKPVKPLSWTEDSKSDDSKLNAEIDGKAPFPSGESLLSPLGRKKLVGKVKPIARVKGTVIEKRVELEKRKLASPAKSVDEKTASEKEAQNPEKTKSDTEKRKELSVSTKPSDDTKKAQSEGDPKAETKIIKTSKKQDADKIAPQEADASQEATQRETPSNAAEDVAKSDSQTVKSTTKEVASANTKKVTKVETVRPAAEGPKVAVKRGRPFGKKRLLLLKHGNVTKKLVKIVKKPAKSNVSDSLKDKKSDDESKKSGTTVDNKVDIKTSKLEKCKTKPVIKTSVVNKAKMKDTIPKKDKSEPKEEEDVKKKKCEPVSSESPSEPTIVAKPSVVDDAPLPKPDAPSDGNKTSINPEKCKGKTTKTDRPPSPKVVEEKPDEPSKISGEEIKKEKSPKAGPSEGKSPVRKTPIVEKSESSGTDTSSDDRSGSRHATPKITKKIVSVPAADVRRKRLMGFWTGPKRHREASLNAVAKVQCLYENENRTHLELGLMKTVDKSSRQKESYKKKNIKTEKRHSISSESEYETKIKSEMTSSEDDSNPPATRTLRHQPGSRATGKYWELKISSSEESEVEHKKRVFEKRKVTPKPKVSVKTEGSKAAPKPQPPKEKKPIPGTTVKKRRKRTEVVMDLRDMVVKKRMASLNASAILAASYEKRSPRSGSGRDETTSDSASSEQDEHQAKKCKSYASSDSRKESSPKREPKTAAKSKVEVIVNQEADVTITGVYSHHEGFCTVSGMQYRISATSHTQTTATASSDKELPSGGSGPGYTPLGALSSMHPPGGVAPPHIHQGAIIQDPRGPLGGSLGRRAGCSSAFSAPHHHSDSDRSPGYYQPAGPLITTTPLHGGFKDGAGPPSLPPEQPSQFGRYSYQQAPPVVHYGGGFAGQYGSHAHYGSGEVCYGGGRAPGSGPAPPAPSCYRPPPAHRSSTSYRPAPLPPGPHDSQISPTAPEAYAPQYCPPCYRHPHAAPQAPVAYIDQSYQGSCPCPLQSCPKNVHTGPATGNPPAGGGPNTNSPPGGSRAPAPILAPPASSFCVDDKRRAKTSNAKDPPLLNRVLKSECSAKIADLGVGARRASPKREYFPEQATGRSRREAGEGRGGCCPVAVNPSLSVIPPEAHGPPSPARGSAGACIPQPPDLPHPRSPAPAQRRARVGKAAARKSIGADDDPGQTTMLLMCQPQTVPADVAPAERPPRTAAGPVAVPPDDAKSEADSGDEVILLDSPSSKMAPIDLSSSDENGADGRSDADCAIVPAEDADDVIDLSVDAKKESPSDELAPGGRGGSLAPDDGAPGKRAADGGAPDEGRLGDAEPKADPKRRRPRPKPEVEADATDGVPAANGIGEHVKLQKRRKALADDRGGSYKDLIKKPDKIFKLNNGKRQLNTIKSERSAPDPSDSDGPHRRKAAGKRKSASPAAEPPPVPKRKKLASSLLKYTDRKQSARHYDDPSAEPADDASPSLPKNKSAILLENLIMKNNNIDPTSESVDKTSAAEAEAPGGGDAGTVAECVPGFLARKGKRGGDVGGDAKGRTVLNINNNVVKKMNEADCAQTTLARDKADGRASIERIARNESKSPGPLVRKSDKTAQKDVPAKAKCPADAKDASSKISKADCPKAKKVAKNKIGAGLKSVKKKAKPADGGESETVELLPIRRLSNPRWSNGWTWEGEPQQGKVYINNEDIPLIAWCYSGMKHDRAGDSVKRGDCVLLRAGARRTEAPFVARVTQLWENPTDGEMMVSLLWYYRPEHTDCGRQPDDCAEEVFASRHRDANSVACIEDKCYVLTFNEYCRYRKHVKATEENIVCPPSIVPSMPASEITPAVVTNDGKVPFNISPDLVLFCRRIYDFRLKKIVKPPN